MILFSSRLSDFGSTPTLSVAMPRHKTEKADVPDAEYPEQGCDSDRNRCGLDLEDPPDEGRASRARVKAIPSAFRHRLARA